jgi:hypothetical protein
VRRPQGPKGNTDTDQKHTRSYRREVRACEKMGERVDGKKEMGAEKEGVRRRFSSRVLLTRRIRMCASIELKHTCGGSSCDCLQRQGFTRQRSKRAGGLHEGGYNIIDQYKS